MKTMIPVDTRSSGRNNAENDNGPSDENVMRKMMLRRKVRISLSSHLFFSSMSEFLILSDFYLILKGVISMSRFKSPRETNKNFEEFR